MSSNALPCIEEEHVATLERLPAFSCVKQRCQVRMQVATGHMASHFIIGFIVAMMLALLATGRFTCHGAAMSHSELFLFRHHGVTLPWRRASIQ